MRRLAWPWGSWEGSTIRLRPRVGVAVCCGVSGRRAVSWWGRAALLERGTVTWLRSVCCSGWFMCHSPVTEAGFGSGENEST